MRRLSLMFEVTRLQIKAILGSNSFMNMDSNDSRSFLLELVVVEEVPPPPPTLFVSGGCDGEGDGDALMPL